MQETSTEAGLLPDLTAAGPPWSRHARRDQRCGRRWQGSAGGPAGTAPFREQLPRSKGYGFTHTAEEMETASVAPCLEVESLGELTFPIAKTGARASECQSEVRWTRKTGQVSK